MAAKSKKLLKVIDGIRAWNVISSQPNVSSSPFNDIEENLKSEHFQVGKGGLVSICQDDVVHLWNIRQKTPELVHSLQFKREHLTCGHVPVGSSWLYLGTDKGNVHFVNVQRFTTSGYIINWNKAIDITQSSHPGRVVQVAENPQDSNKLLIGYVTGLIALWDLRTKTAEARFKCSEPLNGLCWHWEGKSFLTCHNFGLLATWSIRQPQRPISIVCPHSGGETVPDDYSTYDPIFSVDWLPSKMGEPIILFVGGGRSDSFGAASTVVTSRTSGGGGGGSSSQSGEPSPSKSSAQNPMSSSSDTTPSLSGDAVAAENTGFATIMPRSPSLTVKRGKRLIVMQMDYRLIQFTTLCASPYASELMDPYAVAVLLQHDLVVVDLLSPNYATFENPYPMDLHASPVTCCHYLVDCPGDLVPAFYSVGKRRTTCETDAFSTREWPITGGEWGVSYRPFPELVLTGHADGSVRFWDASEVTLTPLYKVRTNKYLDVNYNALANQTRNISLNESEKRSSSPPTDDVNANFSPNLLHTEMDPHAIRFIRFCPESRRLFTASYAHVCLMHFSRRELISDIPVIDLNMAYDFLDEFSGPMGGETFVSDDQSVSNLAAGGGTMTKDNASSGIRSANPHLSGGSIGSVQSAFVPDRDVRVFTPIRRGTMAWLPGYQPTLICRLGIAAMGMDSATDPTLVPPPPITAIGLQSSNGLLAIGNDYGFALIDYHNRVCLLSTSTAEMFGPTDFVPRMSSRSPGRMPMNSLGDGKSVDQRSHHSKSRPPRPPPPKIRPTLSQPSPPTPGMSMTSSPGTVGNNAVSGLYKSHAYTSIDPGQADALVSGTGGRYGPVSRAAAFRGELKRAKSQEKWSEFGPGSQSDGLSTSTSSLEHMSCEGVKIVVFNASYARKNDPKCGSCLWVGTTRGNVFVVSLNTRDMHATQMVNPVIPSGSLFRLQGEIVCLGFLDASGDLISTPSERWSENASTNPAANAATGSTDSATASSSRNAGPNSGPSGSGGRSAKDWAMGKQGTGSVSRTSSSSTSSSTGPGGTQQTSQANTPDGNVPESDKQMLVICSEKQARVVALPSQTALFKCKITETSHVVRASLQRLRPPTIASDSNGSSTFLACYLANGHFIALSLPTLRMLMDVDYLPYTEPVARSFAFGQHAQAVYLTSPSELMKITWAADVCANLRDMQGELFIPCNMPEPPRKNFFRNLLSGNMPTSVDRDELFGGTTSGKSMPGTSVLLPNTRMDKLTGQAGSATSEIAQARNAAIERGERLQQLDLQTQQMMDQSKSFGRSAAMLAAKYEKKDKRWGLPF